MSLKKLLKESIDSHIQSIVDRIEDQMGYNLDDITDIWLVDEGTEAKIYEVRGTNKVIRIEKYADFDKYKQLVGVNHPNIVKVFYSKFVDFSRLTYTDEFNLSLLITVMERLVPLSQKNFDNIHFIERRINIDYIFNYDLDNFERNNFKKWLKKSIEYKKGYLNDKDINKLTDITVDMMDDLKGLRDALYDMESMNIDMNDLHIGNILEDPKTKKLKFIDIGR